MLRSADGLSLNAQYTFGTSKGNTAGSNEAATAANNARAIEEFDYDDGYNNFDVRHTLNLSAVYSVPYGRGRKYGSDAGVLTNALLGGWDVGGIINARSGLPVPVQIVRPDIVYRDAQGNIFANAAAAFTHYPNVTPFAVVSAAQFAPAAPPSLTSAEYARDLNEVKELGSATSATRTADQTLVARLWANVGTPTNFLFVWNNVAARVAGARELSLMKSSGKTSYHGGRTSSRTTRVS